MADNENERLWGRMDRLETLVANQLDSMSKKLDTLVAGQSDIRQTSAGLERAFETLGRMETRIEKLEKYSPFVEIVTNGMKGILTAIFRGSLIIGASIAIAQLWPYLPWAKTPTVPVEIKQPKTTNGGG